MLILVHRLELITMLLTSKARAHAHWSGPLSDENNTFLSTTSSSDKGQIGLAWSHLIHPNNKKNYNSYLACCKSQPRLMRNRTHSTLDTARLLSINQLLYLQYTHASTVCVRPSPRAPVSVAVPSYCRLHTLISLSSPNTSKPHSLTSRTFGVVALLARDSWKSINLRH